MSVPSLHRSLHRLDKLVSEAEDLIDDYPGLGGRKGFLKEVGSILDAEHAREERRAEARLNRIYAEAYGVVVSLKEGIESYGVPASNRALGDALKDSIGNKEAVRNLRAAVGFLRARIDQIG